MKTTITALCLVACLCATTLAEQPKAYGTTVTSYLSLGPDAFQPHDETTMYYRDHFLTVLFPSDFWVYPQLPSGALVTSIAIDFCDDDGGDGPYLEVGFLDRFGNQMGGGNITQSFPSGCSTETLTDFVPIVINNAENRIAIRVETLGNLVNQKLTGLVIGYQLQVSPAPATATFNDVPTSDFGFQYIEALAASGITGGCGGGNYCPDNPVTRRQMAIFLAKALGLQWQ